MDCQNCENREYIEDRDVYMCEAINREISPFWGLVDGLEKCPITNLSRYEESVLYTAEGVLKDGKYA